MDLLDLRSRHSIDPSCSSVVSLRVLVLSAFHLGVGTRIPDCGEADPQHLALQRSVEYTTNDGPHMVLVHF